MLTTQKLQTPPHVWGTSCNIDYGKDIRNKKINTKYQKYKQYKKYAINKEVAFHQPDGDRLKIQVRI